MYAGFACAYFLHDYCIVLLSPQQVIDDLTKEKSEMEERLVDTEQRLNEFEETGQKFLHLQVKAAQEYCRYMYLPKVSNRWA